MPRSRSTRFSSEKLMKLVSIRTRYGGASASLCLRNIEDGTGSLSRHAELHRHAHAVRLARLGLGDLLLALLPYGGPAPKSAPFARETELTVTHSRVSVFGLSMRLVWANLLRRELASPIP